jgi:hypothetical protein
MNIVRTRNSIALALSTLLLATACGGGNDDEAGSFTALGTAPSKFTFDDGNGCATAGLFVVTVYIQGGAAPYRLLNSSPNFITLDKSQVGDRNGSFNIYQTGYGCLSPGSVTVVDKNDRTTTFSLTLGAVGG